MPMVGTEIDKSETDSQKNIIVRAALFRALRSLTLAIIGHASSDINPTYFPVCVIIYDMHQIEIGSNNIRCKRKVQYV